MAYLDKRREDGDYFTRLTLWKAQVLTWYPHARFEVEDHGAFRRLFAHKGDDPTGADQVANFAHNADEDAGHGFVQHAAAA
jgi:hypothetical protein